MLSTGRRTAAGLTALIAALLSSPLLAAPEAVLWERWAEHDPNSAQTVDHGAWQAFLDRHLVADGDLIRVRYGAVSQGQTAILQRYLDRMSAVAVSGLSRPVQKAYWLNLYNALTVDLVVDAYPVDSIKDIMSGLFDSGPWDETVITVEGVELSLDDIEHRILRPIWQDPLIHYGVNCASIGCPNLDPIAYTGGRVDAMLEANARAYVNSARGVIAVDGYEAVVSSIYVWFQDDFGGDAGVLAHLRRFAGDDLKARLESVTDIGGHRYDWSLNDAGADRS